MRRTIVAMLAVFMAGIAGAAAQTYPSQPIHMVVPFPPGGGTDALARAIQDAFQKAIGQTVIIDNRGGGGGSIGHEIVAKAAPDGYTVGFSSNNRARRSLPNNSTPLWGSAGRSSASAAASLSWCLRWGSARLAAGWRRATARSQELHRRPRHHLARHRLTLQARLAALKIEDRGSRGQSSILDPRSS